MFPNSKITIDDAGNSTIEGMEQAADCHKLSEMGEAAGKVVDDKEKDHTPVHQSVHQKGN